MFLATTGKCFNLKEYRAVFPSRIENPIGEKTHAMILEPSFNDRKKEELVNACYFKNKESCTKAYNLILMAMQSDSNFVDIRNLQEEGDLTQIVETFHTDKD